MKVERKRGARRYHYKSPQEIGSRQSDKLPAFFRNRGNLILLLDLFILFLIFIFLNYAGAFEGEGFRGIFEDQSEKNQSEQNQKEQK